MRKSTVAAVSLIAIASFSATASHAADNAAGQGPAAGAAAQSWNNPALPVKARAEAVVAAMTLDEKLSMLNGDVVLDGNGTGMNSCVGHINAIPRLGIPALCMGDGPAGVGNGLRDVTQFAAPIAMAASFDRTLADEYGVALGAEHAGKGRNVVLAPTINIIRSPLWGRMAESFSEDPYLTGALAAPLIRGIQSNGVIATPKHYLANNQEQLRLGLPPAYGAVDARVSERALHEIYMPGFKSAVVDGGAGSLMCAYNRVNGEYACENKSMLDVPRQQWGFDGFVVADWYFAHRSTEAAAMSGLDISMPGGKSPFGFPDYYGQPLRDAVAAGKVPMARIDQMVANVVTPMIRNGLLTPRIAGNADANVRSPAHDALMLKVVQEGTVLLRNQGGVLPLGSSVKSIAVIGDDAGPHVQTTERYGGFVADAGIAKTSPLDAIKARVGSGALVTYAEGTSGLAPLPAFPAKNLRTPDGKPGLRASYYRTASPEGAPALVRDEATAPDAADARPKDWTELWSARWDGTFTPETSGLHRFTVTGGGGLDLYIDGKPVVQAQQDFRSTFQGAVELKANVPVTIRMDYRRGPPISAPELRLGWEAPQPERIAKAVEAARKSDVAVVFVADQASEGADRTSLALPGDENALIEAVAAVNPRTVVVLHTVGPVLMPWRDKVAGIVMGWYPGEKAAEGLASVLFGDTDASGRLPVTFPARDADVASTKPVSARPGDPVVAYDEGLLVGYRWFGAKGVQPLYPFGHGLSYTRFSFSRPSVEASAAGHGKWIVKTTVRNLGDRAGVAVPQLYVGYPKAAMEAPWQLRGFDRITLAPRESKVVTFTIDRAAFAMWDDAAHAERCLAGQYALAIGKSAGDLGQPVTVKVDQDCAGK